MPVKPTTASTIELISPAASIEYVAHDGKYGEDSGPMLRSAFSHTRTNNADEAKNAKANCKTRQAARMYFLTICSRLTLANWAGPASFAVSQYSTLAILGDSKMGAGIDYPLEGNLVEVPAASL